MKALKPDLYTVPRDAPDAPALRGGRCACGHVFFPMQRYGCEVCGRDGDAMTPVDLGGTGALVASARVLVHVRKDRTPPFTVASVRLDEGPLVRALLDRDPTEPLPVGTRMRMRAVETGRDEAGEAIVDLRFSPAE